MSNEQHQTILDLDELMDMEMDKVETLPDFITPPAGNYILSIPDAKIEKYQQKAKEGRQSQQATRIKIFYAVEKTLELSNNKDLPVKDGSLFTDSFMGTEEGLKYFKRQAMNILNVTDLEGARLKDILEGLKDQSFPAKITIRTTTENGQNFENAQVRPMHGEAAK